MKVADPGLRVITESWLGTYCQALEIPGLTRAALLRLDPAPRVDVLVAAGVLSADHAAIASLKATFQKVLLAAPSANGGQVL